jgi:ankyrin repeat protein
LHLAAKYGNRRVVQKLLDANAVVNAQTYNRQPFSFVIGGWAAESRRLPCRQTPLHCAAEGGHTGVIEELLLKGADVTMQNCLG